MATIVDKLQQLAMEPDVPVSDLLRRVKFAAVKLGLENVEAWVEQELNGYEVKPPDYRVVHGIPSAHHPLRGWEPIGGHIEYLATQRIGEPVSALEALVAKSGGQLQISYPDWVREKLDQTNGVRGWSYSLHLPSSELKRILDRVRTLVLDWALNLEKSGIMGTDESFNDVEKKKAHAASTTINIGNIGSFVGNLGQGHTSGAIDASGIKSDQLASIISQLRLHHSELVENGADGKRLQETLAGLEAAVANKKDQGLIRELLVDVRNSLSGATGSLIATGAINVLNAILGTGVPST